ncbi:MAG: radical SAM protein [Chloroflexota bacterium]
MKILIISTNTLPAAPSGPAYIAGALRQAGHQVEIYECLFSNNLHRELAYRLSQFQPEVVGVSIRLVHGDVQDPAAPFGTRYLDLRPRVKEVVEITRQASSAKIILGGPGFNYYAREWLEYLALPIGVRGEGEVAFPLLLQALANGTGFASLPGCVTLQYGCYTDTNPTRVTCLDAQGLPAYDLCDWEEYASRGITPALFTKRGCAFGCTFCPYGKLEGKQYRLKSPERVLDEIVHTLKHTPNRRIMFCDNSFNVPKTHAEKICQAILSRKIELEWGTGDIKPLGLDDSFCRMMRASGCFYVNLAVESACDGMLSRMKRGYTARQVRASLECLSRSGIPFGASLLFGAPGETPETIAETLSLLDEYHIPLGVWVTIGVYLWTEYQDIVNEARRDGLPAECESLFDGAVYLSPALSPNFLVELVSHLRAKPGYTVQVNRSDRLSALCSP